MTNDGGNPFENLPCFMSDTSDDEQEEEATPLTVGPVVEAEAKAEAEPEAEAEADAGMIEQALYGESLVLDEDVLRKCRDGMFEDSEGAEPEAKRLPEPEVDGINTLVAMSRNCARRELASLNKRGALRAQSQVTATLATLNGNEAQVRGAFRAFGEGLRRKKIVIDADKKGIPLSSLGKDACVAACLEKGKKEGRLHMHLYIHTGGKRVRLQQLRKKLSGSAWWGFADAPPRKVLDYMEKDINTGDWEPRGVGRIVTHGEFPRVAAGRRMDIEANVLALKEGKTMLDLIDPERGGNPNTVVPYLRNFEKIKMMLEREKLEGKSFPKTVFWIYGPPGTGKSHAAEEWARARGMSFWRSSPNRMNWYDGFWGQDVVIFDDLRLVENKTLSQDKFVRLLGLLDKYFMHVPIKGGMVPWIPKVIFVTTPLSVKDTCGAWEGVGDELGMAGGMGLGGQRACQENVAQLERRITGGEFYFDQVYQQAMPDRTLRSQDDWNAMEAAHAAQKEMLDVTQDAEVR